MIIGIVDDDVSKRETIRAIVARCGGDSTILQCGSLSAARRMLRDTALDLLILDIALPEHEDSGDPVKDGGITLLGELTASNRFKMPKHVIGLTALAEVHEEAVSRFGSELWSVLRYDPASEEWAERLSAKVRHLLRLKSCQASAEPGCDLAIVVALKTPELDAVLALPWDWAVVDRDGDATVYHRGTFRRRDGTLGTAIAVRAGQMGMPAATALATKVALLFRPRCLAMVGICAGNKDGTALGDLIVANPTWDYGSGKHMMKDETPSFEPAPYPLALSTRVRSIVERHEGETDMLSALRKAFPGKPPASVPNLHIGPFASGAAVVARGSMVTEVKEQQHRKLLAIDMEAYGVAMASHELPEPQPEFLIVKGVSDFADEDKGEAHRDYAAFMSARYLALLCTDYALC